MSGSIHLSAPRDLGRNQIVPLLDRFVALNPEITFDLTLNDGYVDLVGQGNDLALRYGETSDSTMKASRLGDSRRLVCASPAYLNLNGTPRHPDDLVLHNCLIMRFGANTDRDWPFTIEGQKRTFRVHGDRIANDGDRIRLWCLNGHGVALKSEWDVRSDPAAGHLIVLLEDFLPARTARQMVYPAGAVQPRRVRAVMRFLSETLNQNLTS